jgi:FAD dependent oxidoreductase TIGR03364
VNQLDVKGKTAIVIGAGIVGLALSRALAVRGCKVTVFERNERPVGASIRNFGMIWPIGVPNGLMYQRALHSRAIWREFLDEAGVWYAPSGSLHVAYADDEMAVIEEYAAANQDRRPAAVLNKQQTLARSSAVVASGLRGALWNGDEMVLDPRLALRALPAWLSARYGVHFHWKTAISRIEHPHVWTGTQRHSADLIYVASGADFETLYPQVFAQAPITKCKLQMIRLVAQPADFKLGPSLCGGLSMVHYPGFEVAPSVAALRARYAHEHADLLARGIHVMAVQNGSGEITTGDSHDYAHTHDPFDEVTINQQILDYLHRFADFPDWTIGQTWHGIYSKLTDGSSELVVEPEPGVTIVNAPGGGGLGMTLSFGLCDELIAGNYASSTSKDAPSTIDH